MAPAKGYEMAVSRPRVVVIKDKSTGAGATSRHEQVPPSTPTPTAQGDIMVGAGSRAAPSCKDMPAERSPAVSAWTTWCRRAA